MFTARVVGKNRNFLLAEYSGQRTTTPLRTNKAEFLTSKDPRVRASIGLENQTHSHNESDDKLSYNPRTRVHFPVVLRSGGKTMGIVFVQGQTGETRVCLLTRGTSRIERIESNESRGTNMSVECPNPACVRSARPLTRMNQSTTRYNERARRSVVFLCFRVVRNAGSEKRVENWDDRHQQDTKCCCCCCQDRFNLQFRDR